jgi:hypothetical protein
VFRALQDMKVNIIIQQHSTTSTNHVFQYSIPNSVQDQSLAVGMHEGLDLPEGSTLLMAADCFVSCSTWESEHSAHISQRVVRFEACAVPPPPPAPPPPSASFPFGPNREHKLNCQYAINEDGTFNMTSTGCKFEMAEMAS